MNFQRSFSFIKIYLQEKNFGMTGPAFMEITKLI